MRPTPAPEHEVRALSEEECMGLLARAWLGRVGFTRGGLPAIVPVRYRFLDGEVLFGAGSASGLFEAIEDSVIAFQADGEVAGPGPAWSVVVVGRARRVTDRGLVPCSLEPPLVRLRPELVSGYGPDRVASSWAAVGIARA